MRERLVRGAGLAGAGFFLSRALTFGGYVAIAGLVSPAAVGQFAAATVLVGMALLFAESGMLAAVIQWRDDVDEAASTAFASTVVTGTALTVLAAAAAPLIGLFFGSRLVGEIAAVSAGFLLLRSLAIVPEALLQRRFSFLRMVVVGPLGALAFAVGAIVAALEDMGPWSLVVGTYALYAVEAMSAWVFVRWRPRRSQMSMAVWRRLVGFARHVVFSEVIRRTTVQLDSIVLGRFAGVAPLGQYTYGLRLAGQPSAAFVSIAAYILLPAFARMADEPERLRVGFRESFQMMGLMVLPVSLLLLPLGDQLVLLVFGPQWEGAGQALKALCLLGVGVTWVSLASEAFKAVGRPQLLTRVHTSTLVASAVLLPSLVWAEEVGVGLAVSAAAMISAFYAMHHAARVVGTTLGDLLGGLRGAAAATAAALAVTGAADWLVFGGESRGGAAVTVAIESAVFGATYLAALRLLARRDLERLAGMARQLRRRRPAPVEA